MTSLLFYLLDLMQLQVVHWSRILRLFFIWEKKSVLNSHKTTSLLRKETSPWSNHFLTFSCAVHFTWSLLYSNIIKLLGLYRLGILCQHLLLFNLVVSPYTQIWFFKINLSFMILILFMEFVRVISCKSAALCICLGSYGWCHSPRYTTKYEEYQCF